jgi:fructuronate reductase
LSNASLSQLPAGVARPGHDRSAPAARIVHFGIGAFHRAHQAWYTDAAINAGDRPWAITGVSLRSPAVAAQLVPQDGLFTLAERSASGETLRVVGAVRDCLVASADPQAVIDAVADAATHIVSFTITEKGYCRTASGDLDPDLAAAGFYPLLTAALRRRRASGAGGLTLMSCDNLASNGRQLDRLLRQYLASTAPDLVDWFTAHCTCPDTMVDRIVPATTEADRAAISTALGGLDDQACVVTEAFSQWVIEDLFAGPRPQWEKVGATLVTDVAPYETAKLRMLNGAHSALAYLGIQLGLVHVHDAIGDARLRPLIERLMRDEALPTVPAAPGQGLDGYADALLARFANPALNHRLAQIAMDGSQKIPQRWLETLAANTATNRPSPALLRAVAAWICHVRGDNIARLGPVEDPLAAPLAAATQGRSIAEAASRLFGPHGLLQGPWTPTPDQLAQLAQAPAIELATN